LPHRHRHNDIVYPDALPFVIVHLACIGIIWTGASVTTLALCFGLYLLRMFAVTAGNHRYFSHRSYKTSRLGQFLLAVVCQTAAQRGVVWWAAMHRAHHRHSDTVLDPHSPRHSGFWYSHVGWIFDRQNKYNADYTLVGDLTKFPELMWLNRHRYLPAIALGFLMWLVGGWEVLLVGFILSTVLLYHGTFSINSVAHVVGKQRYVTGDDSRNNFWLALITLGEGWHNNHHHFQSSTRQGFRWWEVDITFYVLKAMALFRVVWDLKEPPRAVVRGERRLARPVIEKVAQELAATFSAARISRQIGEAWANTPDLEDLRERAKMARTQAAALLAEVQLPHVPTLEDLQHRAQKMFAHSPSLDDIVERARQIILEAISMELLNPSLVPASNLV
jgi:stearoyl-CoA desaturase (delta-9 desaturase)